MEQKCWRPRSVAGYCSWLRFQSWIDMFLQSCNDLHLLVKVPKILAFETKRLQRLQEVLKQWDVEMRL